MKRPLGELVAGSGVKFGTSGVRGLVEELTDRICHVYTVGFLQYLRSSGELPARDLTVGIAGDLRPSTERLMKAVSVAVRDFGGAVLGCGRIPSPALALLGLERRIPTIMVTGSHIPDDRNGIKFNKPTGEILKQDEIGIVLQELEIDEFKFAANGMLKRQPGFMSVDPGAGAAYVRRYLEAFPGRPLAGLRVGVYQHSAVGRDLLMEILSGLGVEAAPLARSDTFVPVDTEAIRNEDAALAREWAAREGFDAVASCDGDSDRPLISDERGVWLRGDVAGILCARFLNADSVTTPISSNTAVERSGWFPEVRRTRIGSPFVVEAMNQAIASGGRRVVGYEANGGFLIGTPLIVEGRVLPALPTRDAVIVILGVLLMARRAREPISRLVATLPARFTASDRLANFSVARSRQLLARFSAAGELENRAALESVFGALAGGRVESIDRTDGLRTTFNNGEIVHLRPSGNAPELRCYTEAGSESRATELCAACLAVARALQTDERVAPGKTIE